MIPWKDCEEGAKLCLNNARRLLDSARFILQAQYSTPHAIPTALAQDVKYSSCCGLVISAIEEIGKGYFLLEKYHARHNVAQSEWERYTRRNAHVNKILYAQRLLGSSNPIQARELNRIKQSDIYVDWQNRWQSPMALNQRVLSQKSQNLLHLADLLLQEFERRF